jgi:hypothetical protein
MFYFRSVLTLAIPLFAGALSAQCIADAGPEVLHLCLGQSKVYLQATANGGQAPYSFKWSMKTDTFHTGSKTYYFHASDYLNDTTSANPEFMGYTDSSLTFYLQVTDANSIICYDTVKVSTSAYTHYLVTHLFHIKSGDSAQFFGLQSASNYPMDSIYWYPSGSLSDPNALAPKASPDTTTTYSYIMWDIKGCSDTNRWASIIYVDHLNLTSLQTLQLKVYPTKLKFTDDLILKNPNGIELNFTLMDTRGQKILETKIYERDNKIELPPIPTGIYFYQLTQDHSIIKTGRLLIEQ